MADLSVLQEVLELKSNRKEVATATIIKASGSSPRGVGTMMGVLKDRTIIGSVGGGSLENRVIGLCLEALESGESRSFNLDLGAKGVAMTCGGEIEVFIDVYKNRPKLLIFGGGHVGYAIYRQALLLDFDIFVFDDREEFLNRERFPHAQGLLLGDFQESFKEAHIDDATYIVVVTRGHDYDEVVLENIVNSDARYIGSMGSKRKMTEIMKNLKSKGFDEKVLKKVYGPVGLDIACQNPEEIAVSIISEILLIKNNGSARHRKIDL